MSSPTCTPSSPRLCRLSGSFNSPDNILTFVSEPGLERLDIVPYPWATLRRTTPLPPSLLWRHFADHSDKHPQCFHGVNVRTFKIPADGSFMAACGHNVVADRCNYWMNLSDIARNERGRLVMESDENSPNNDSDDSVEIVSFVPRRSTCPATTLTPTRRGSTSAAATRVRRAPTSPASARTRRNTGSLAATRPPRPSSRPQARRVSSGVGASAGPAMSGRVNAQAGSSSSISASRRTHARAGTGTTVSAPPASCLPVDDAPPPYNAAQYLRSILMPADPFEQTPITDNYHDVDSNEGVLAHRFLENHRICWGCNVVFTARHRVTHICDLAMSD